MLGELRLDTMKIHIYDSFLQGHFYDRLVQQGHIQNFKKQVVALLDSINYWQNRGIPRIDIDLEIIMETWVPQQSGPLGDCAVWSCLLLEYAISGVRVPVQGTKIICPQITQLGSFVNVWVIFIGLPVLVIIRRCM
ncbi:hypothetical protein L2E82_07846 [Cichorium intybus]|uniref:Uncharacterized protein n=1 Tax=Cichorium intybus TaxID=13427 RepID=A0ACB9G4P2_CICIN|nr:hypothetical protein L2E82_07846 [Cichorium intybus]